MKNRKKLIKEEREYLKKLEDQLSDNCTQEQFHVAVEWRFNQAESYRTMEYWLQWGQIIINFVIATLGAFQTLKGDYLGIAIIIISSFSSVLMTIKSKYKCSENWKRYRNSLEQIKSLTRRYLSVSEPFEIGNIEGNKRLYLLLLDRIIMEEAHEWKIMREQDLKE